MNSKLFKSWLFILTLALIAFGCTSEDDPVPSLSSYKFQAKVNGTLKQTNAVTNVSASNFSVVGTFGNASISLSTDAPPSVGTFQLKDFDFDNFYSGRYTDASTTYETTDGTGTGTGTLTFTKVTLNNNGDVTELKGTFSFTAYNGTSIVSITEGVIDYK